MFPYQLENRQSVVNVWSCCLASGLCAASAIWTKSSKELISKWGIDGDLLWLNIRNHQKKNIDWDIWNSYPVLDHTGVIIAAIYVEAQTNGDIEMKLEVARGRVIEVAKTISTELGYLRILKYNCRNFTTILSINQ